MSLMKKNPLVLVLGGFLLLVLGKSFFGRKSETKAPETAQTPTPETTGVTDIAAKSEIGQLFSTLDWTVTTPGKAVAELLGGAGWANWLLWSVVVLFIYMVAQSFIKPKGDGVGKSLVTFIWVALVSVALYAAITFFLSREVTTHATVDLRQARTGQFVDVRMGFTSVAVVQIRAANLQKDGDVYFWACPETIWPVKLPFAPKFEVVAGAYTTQNHVALTKESKQALMENGTSVIDVRFTFTAARTNPCPNLKQVGSS